MKRFTSKTQKIGQIGEEVAIKFLKKHKYKIIARNYTKKWGEIDIVAKNKGILHFIEVKSVSDDGLNKFSRENLSRETDYRPEENVHPQKLKRIYRTIETYLSEKDFEGEWQLDIIAVFIDIKARKSGIRHIKNVF